MKKILIIIVALAAIFFGWKYFYKPKILVKPQVEGAQTNLEQDLKLTEDDGGVTDFKELDKSAEGL